MEKTEEKLKDNKENILYKKPTKNLEEAKARVGRRFKLNSYGLAEEPAGHFSDYIVPNAIFLGIACAILSIIIFYGNVSDVIFNAIIFDFILNVLVFGIAGGVVGALVGALNGFILALAFYNSDIKKSEEDEIKRCEALNRKYNLRKIDSKQIEVQKAIVHSNRDIEHFCPECGGKVNLITLENKIGFIEENPVSMKIKTYECEDCGFSYYSENTIIENKDKSSNSNNDKKSTVSKTESLIYKTDKKCSEMTSRIFNEKAYKKTIN
ncbi:MAG: YrzE family protein [Clostridia bacterium]|nr:YrzE family protein [Clostridia bacterium]